MSTEDEHIARKLFDVLNVKNKGYLSLNEFLNGMLTIKSQNISEKIDLFFKVSFILIIMQIIDKKGNGRLDYKDVIDISKISIKRTIKDDASAEIVDEVSEYFAKLIFRLVNIDYNEVIDLSSIKEVLLMIFI